MKKLLIIAAALGALSVPALAQQRAPNPTDAGGLGTSTGQPGVSMRAMRRDGMRPQTRMKRQKMRMRRAVRRRSM